MRDRSARRGSGTGSETKAASRACFALAGIARFALAGIDNVSALALSVCVLAVPAMAAEVGYPKEHPKVAMEVPDGWAVTYTAAGLEIVSPEKNLVILADLLPRKKADADDWAIKAETRLGTFGVSFAKNGAAQAKAEAAKTEAAKPEPAGSDAKDEHAMVAQAPKAEPAKAEAAKTELDAKPAEAGPSTVAPSEAPTHAAPPVAGGALPSGAQPSAAMGANGKIDRSAPTFTFMNPPIKIEPPAAPEPPPAAAYFGSPSLGTPTRTTAPTSVRTDVPQSGTLEELTRPPVIRPKIPFAVGRLPTAMMDGQPVDVQIVNYAVSQSQLFLMIQASGPSDDRAVAILQSVKPAP